MSQETTTTHKKKSGNAAFHDFVNDFSHIEDPLERRRLALEKIDNVKFGWYHVRAICVGGVGFLTDAYDIFAINLAVTMLQYVFWEGNMPASTQTILKVSTSVGTVIGQLGFGRLADAVGRHKIYGSELIIMIVATIFQVTLGESPSVNFAAILVFWRIVMGIGIGADYPTSSVITSEFATTKHRGAIIGSVFANQGWGQLLAGIVSVIVVRAYKEDLIVANTAAECTGQCLKAVDQMWRVLVGFGAVPGICALYFRLTIPPSPRYQLNTLGDGEQDEPDFKKANATVEIEQDSVSIEEQHPTPNGTLREFCQHFRKWKHMKILIGTAGSWFMLDVAFYGLGLNTSVILEAIGYASDKNIYDKMFNVCAGNLILICAGSIPGYWFSVFTVDILGRKFITIMGFTILTVLFCVIGFAYDKLSQNGLLALYVLSQFFQNFGPNATTYIIAAECFPSRFRSTAHGISAASGKLGAIVAQTALGTLVNHGCSADNTNCFLPHVMEIFALFMALGIATGFLLPETKRQTLEDLAERLHGEVNPNRLAKERAAARNSDNNIQLDDFSESGSSSNKKDPNMDHTIEV